MAESKVASLGDFLRSLKEMDGDDCVQFLWEAVIFIFVQVKPSNRSNIMMIILINSSSSNLFSLNKTFSLKSCKWQKSKVQIEIFFTIVRPNSNSRFIETQ